MTLKASSTTSLAILGILGFLSGPIARAQIQPQPLLCSIDTTARPMMVRAEGVAEPLSDIVITCTGGTPTAAGQPVPTASLTVFYNTDDGSRVTSAPFVDALLIVDEPHTVANAAPLLVCDPGGDTNGVCTIRGAGTGAGTYNGTAGRPNVFQASNTGFSQFTFAGVPIDAPGQNQTRTFRITNLRANVAFLSGAVPNTISAGLSVFPYVSLPLDNPQVTVGVIQPGLVVTGGATASVSSCSNAAAGAQYSISFQEGFATAFRPRNIAQVQEQAQIFPGQFGSDYPAPLNQNVPGFLYNTETQFFNGALGDPNSSLVDVPSVAATPVFPSVRGLNVAGLADQGTRLYVRFSGLPATMSLQVPVRIGLFVSNYVSGWAVLVSTDSNGAGPYSPILGNAGGLVGLTASGGVATAVYEVVYSDPTRIEKLTIPVTARGSGTLPSGQQITVRAGLAPISTSSDPTDTSGPLPRFAASTSTLPAAYLIQACGAPDLAIALAHSGAFGAGGTGTLTITVTNSGDKSTSGLVTVVDNLPTGLTATAMSGGGWSCNAATATCTRADILAPGASYPAITLSVSVAANAPISATNTASVAGGGEVVTANDSVSDTIPLTPVQAVIIETDPAGIVFVVDDKTYYNAATFSWLAGSAHTVSVSSPQTLAGGTYIFNYWTDGGAQSHTIVAGSTPSAAYLAKYGPPSSAMQCAVGTSGAPTIRAEGLAEPVGDLVLQCTGGTPTAAGMPVPQMDIRIFLTTPVTSRLTHYLFTEALLLVDEPHTFLTSAVPFLTCGAAGTNDDGTGVCSIVGDGQGLATYSGAAGHPNIFQAQVEGPNVLLWRGVPVDASLGGRTLRFTNLRANAYYLGVSSSLVPSTVIANVSATPGGMAINSSQQAVGYISKGLVATPSAAADLNQCTSANPAIAADASKALDASGQNGQQFTIQFDEGFPGAWKEKNIQLHLSNDATATAFSYPPDSAQDVPGSVYYSETGFLANGVSTSTATSPGGYGPFLPVATALPALRGMDKAGIADSGTRLSVSFTAIQSGVKLFVPTIVPLTVPLLSNAQTGFAVLTKTDATGTGAFSAATGNVSGLAPLTIAGGSATAVYEVLYANPYQVERVTIPVAAAFLANGVAPGQILVQTSFAPVSGVTSAADLNTPAPRFVAPLSSVWNTAFNIKTCAPKPSLTASPAAVSLQAAIGDSAPVPVPVAIGSTGSVLDFTVSSDQAWLRPSPSAGNTASSSTISVSANLAGLVAGTYNGNIIVNSSGASAALKIAVTLKVLPAPILVTVTTNPPGLSFAVGTNWFTSAQTYRLQPGDTLALTTLGLQSLPSQGLTRYVWQSWSDGGAMAHTFVASGSGAVTLTANFKAQYTLTMSSTGVGTVQPASGYFDANTLVPVTATPGACSALGGFSLPLTNGSLLMDGPKTLTTTFNADTATVVGALAADGKTEQGQLHFAVTGNRRVTGTNRWRRTYNVTNNGAALKRVSLALDGPLTNVTTLFNAAGVTACATPAGSGFITLPDLPQGATAAITLEVTTADPTQQWSGALRVLAAGKP